jgi:pimeloyl-ACP methyl ester carboxylesterase
MVTKRSAVRRPATWCLGVIWAYAVTVLVLVPEGHQLSHRLAWLAVILPASLIGLGVAARAPAWLRGVSLLFVGFAMLPVLFGAIAERAMKDLSVGAVLGVLAGAAAIALIAMGWPLALRGLRQRWARTTVAVLGSVAILQFLTVPATLAVIATNRARPTLSGRTPADAGLAYEDVRITNDGAPELAAWWIPPRNGRAVIVLPGSGSSRDDVIDHGAVLAHAGSGVVLLDLAGHGDSGGRIMDFGWGAERDVSRAVTWTLQQPNVRAVGLLGLSMGGEVALTTAAQDPRVRAVVAEGATARTWDDARLLPESNPVALANDWLEFRLTRLLSGVAPPERLADAVARIQVPVLLITGSAQQESAYGARYAAAAPGTLTWWSLPDTGHIQALATHPEVYEQRVIELFERM